jgi:hypothetical protein
MKCSRASFKFVKLASIGFLALRSRRGIATFLTARASTVSKADGSDVALKPRRTNSIALTSARIASTDSKKREFFERFMECRLLSCSPEYGRQSNLKTS